jgi:hypothetical protein
MVPPPDPLEPTTSETVLIAPAIAPEWRMTVLRVFPPLAAALLSNPPLRPGIPPPSKSKAVFAASTVAAVFLAIDASNWTRLTPN